MLFRLAGEIKHSLVNGPGIRYVVFFQGCPHHCEGCQNPETHDISGGMEADTDAVMERIRKAKFLDGVTLSGGDPLMQPEACGSIARAAHDMGLSVWVYTGWTMDDILCDARKREALRYVDILVDGEFVSALQGEEHLFRGSSNQRFIDVQKSLSTNQVVEVRPEKI